MEKIEYDSICTESGSYRTHLNRMYKGRKPWKRPDPKQILSFMPGTVDEVKVKAGDKVCKGDILLIFRAMKMNNKILAPMAGVIKDVHVRMGENIAKEVIMVELE